MMLLAGLVLWDATGEARKAGVSGRAEGGCTCHGGGTADASIQPNVEGLPARYEPEKSYSMAIGVKGGPPYTKAGFDLKASQGRLSAATGEANVQVTSTATFGGSPGEATHKSPGSRSWKVEWTAPAAGAGKVIFHLAVNSVNGNDQPDLLDKWNLVTLSSDEVNLAPRPVKLDAATEIAPGTTRISWSANIEPDVVRVEVHKGTKAAFPLISATRAATVANPAQTTANVSKLLPETTYYFRVRLVDKGGLTSDSNEISFTTSAPVVTPAPASGVGQSINPIPALNLAPIVAVLAAAALCRRCHRSRGGANQVETRT